MKNKTYYKTGNIELKDQYTTLSLSIKNIKRISGEIEIPLKNDVFAITGNNGTGKSTLISILSLLVPPYSLRLSNVDIESDSNIEFSVYDLHNKWTFPNGRYSREGDDIRFEGRYEGSLFYGKRFEDSKMVEELINNGQIKEDLLVNAEDFIVKSLGIILHGDENYYTQIMRLKNRDLADQFNLKNLPYFMSVNNKIISQYKMSSGECLLLTLLHFLYNSIVRKSIPIRKHVILLVDEIELALHPVAVKRLIELLQNITKSYGNLTCIISSHSLEVIRSVSPSNIFNLQTYSENEGKRFVVDNPIYPCYLMKDIYLHNGYDYVVLVEDKLASMIVGNSITKLKLRKNKLIDIVPIGGWENVLTLHKTFITENTLGIDTKIISIIDGDVKSIAESKFKNLKHTFLPVSSVEKFVMTNIFSKNAIAKDIKDTIFTGILSLDSFLAEYNEEEKNKANESSFKADNNGKRLYGKLKNYCESQRKISEDKLIDILYDIAERNVDFSSFEKSLLEFLS